MSKRRVFCVIMGVILLSVWGVARAEKPDSAPLERAALQGTPVDVSLPTSTNTAEPPAPTVTRTPTSQGPVLVEAKNPDTNVRAGPDISQDRLGRIQPGERYVALSRRFEWIQIEFPNSPSRIGWVHESVVNFIGDPTEILDIDPEQLPTVDTTLAAQRETEIAITQTPGGIITLTAQSFVTPQGLLTAVQEPTRTLAPGERLPTFTYPPFTNTPIPVQELQASRVVNQSEGSNFAPAIPVLALAALGLFGLFVGIFRRL